MATVFTGKEQGMISEAAHAYDIPEEELSNQVARLLFGRETSFLQALRQSVKFIKEPELKDAERSGYSYSSEGID